MMKGQSLSDRIAELSQKSEHPDGTEYLGLSVKQVARLEKELLISSKTIEIAALENGIVPQRYARNFKAFSLKDQATLLRSRVAVVGLGGLGGGVVEILARTGVGSLILIDGDVFDDTNLNRQLLSSKNLLGVSKADAGARRVAEINGSVEVVVHRKFLDRLSAEQMLSGADAVVDCLDSVSARFTVEKAARRLKIPMISAAVAGATGQLTAIFPEDDGLSLIYGSPETASPKGAEQSLGCLSPGVTLLSSLESSEVVKVLLNRGEVLRNRLLLIDLDTNTFETMRLV
jgi:molybdopterin/thiamine biosynthesis adenylyltransferase